MEWKRESAQGKVSHKDNSIISKPRKKEEENLLLIILLTHIMSDGSGLHGVTNSVGNLPAYQRITLSALTNGLFGPFMTKPHEHTRTFQSFVQFIFLKAG